MKPIFTLEHKEHCKTYVVDKAHSLSEAVKMAREISERHRWRYGGRYTKKDLYDDEGLLLYHEEYWYFEIVTI